MNNPYYRGPPNVSGNMHQHYEEQEYEAPPSYSEVLDSVALGTDERNIELLNQIDKLRECGVGEYIDLPQIVVVGDQSSGKSSVLEALTSIPFPRSNVKCTRFATQIRLRRADQVETKVRILADKEQSPAEKQRLATFEKSCSNQTDFATIFEQAKNAIFPPGAANSFLSKDILSVEVSGPGRPHLTVVDLPGIIQSATGTQTERDMEAIKSLAESYMQKERTIILAVVSGAYDISNQIVLRMVKTIDPRGIRTIGVITKPDMTETIERRKEFIDLATNKDPRNKLHLGWHVVRNRKPDEMHLTFQERKDLEDQFFRSSDWGARLDPSQLGVDALSKNLSKQLIGHIADETHKVRADIERELEKCKEKLARLGDKRDTIEEMRNEFFRWCDRSRALTQAAVQGHGTNPRGEDFFPSSRDNVTWSRNFRSAVVERNYAFAAQMEGWGSTYVFIEDEGMKQNNPLPHDISGAPAQRISKVDYINNVVFPTLRDNRGQELAVDTNPLLVYRLFQGFSKKWIDYAEKHIRAVHQLSEAFLQQVLQTVWPHQLHSRVWDGFIQQEVEERLEKAMKELGNLALDRMRLVTAYETNFVQKYYELKGAEAAKQGSDLARQPHEDVLRKMLLLYESRLKTFVENVIVQTVERHVVDGLEDIFSDQRVRNLDDREISDMVEDDFDVQTDRRQLRTQRAVLEQGKEICDKIMRRPDLGPFKRQKLNTKETSLPTTPRVFGTAKSQYTGNPSPSYEPQKETSSQGTPIMKQEQHFVDFNQSGRNQLDPGVNRAPQLGQRAEHRKPVTPTSSAYDVTPDYSQYSETPPDVGYGRTNGTPNSILDETFQSNLGQLGREKPSPTNLRAGRNKIFGR